MQYGHVINFFIGCGNCDKYTFLAYGANNSPGNVKTANVIHINIIVNIANMVYRKLSRQGMCNVQINLCI